MLKERDNRPVFPKRAVITGGMPYGNKNLHFGHIGGVFVFADVFARFLRDRIGGENVVFVSGTDCYGSPIAESYRLAKENGFKGDITDFVGKNHEAQKKVLDDYQISLDLFGASGLGRTGEIHQEFSDWFINTLYNNGELEKRTAEQFYDEKAGTFLNGRQVIGKCPIQNCQSEKGYADECDLGHQYSPKNLINPKSTLTGETPVMKDVDNWYFTLPQKREWLLEFNESLKKSKNIRPVVHKTIAEFLEPPVIHIMNEFMERYLAVKSQMVEHELVEEPKKPSFTIKFTELADCDKACELLTQNNIRFRTGKTLVPFRLTGNIEWGVKAPELEGTKGLTVWVWPESLWAPISEVKAYFERQGNDINKWKEFFCSEESEVYQFIGQDNIYFYGVAEPAMFKALNMNFNMPVLIANHHVLFLDKKASSSGEIKPPMADELLNYYTAEQLRMHFLGMGLGKGSVSFKPKPLDPNAKPNEQDGVLKEGFLLSNVLNRIIRTAFYDCQKYFDGIMPSGVSGDFAVDEKVLDEAKKAILEYERYMYKFEFHQVTYVLDWYIRNASKYMSKAKADADKYEDNDMRKKWLVNVFHMLKTSALLLHPIAPLGVEMLAEYLCFDERIFNWDNAFLTLDEMYKPQNHKLKFLEPRVDFFKRHESQFGVAES